MRVTVCITGFTLVMLTLLVGCSSTSAPSLKQYLLRTEAPVNYSPPDSSLNLQQGQLATVGIGSVSVASYIDGLGLVLETSGGKVHVARDHQWVEPLRLGLRSFLSSKISEKFGQPVRAYNDGKMPLARRIDIRIDELHGTANGEAKLVAYWVTSDPEKQVVLSEGSYQGTEALTRDGYDALVEAEKKLLGRLAADIATTL